MGASTASGAMDGRPVGVTVDAKVGVSVDLRVSLQVEVSRGDGGSLDVLDRAWQAVPAAGSLWKGKAVGCGVPVEPVGEIPVRATQAISAMRGGAQSHLMLGEDQTFWVVKFKNNPQHARVLANEFWATRIAEAVGLSVPRTAMIDVGEWLIQNSPQLMIDFGDGRRERCLSGLQFGSRFGAGVPHQQVFDLLPGERLHRVCNLGEFAPMLVFDRWTSNTDRRQAIFQWNPPEPEYRVLFIDQGSCFSGSRWEFREDPLLGVCADRRVYAAVTGWESFEPWLTRMEQYRPELLWQLASGTPAEWHGAGVDRLESLVETLLARRSRLREMIRELQRSSDSPFPNWREGRLFAGFGEPLAGKG